MSKEYDRQPNCADIRALMQARSGRIAVAIIIHGTGAEERMQFVTYGESAADKVESHNIKEWLIKKVFSGERPDGTTHESLILDAAQVKQERDELLDACKLMVAYQESTDLDDESEDGEYADGKRAMIACRTAIAKAGAP